MNRYRTVPGLGPSSSKATATTTCQKCLQKGHYSYECKSSVQSRPYTSRPSRSQQLANPKLKPRLAEQKMEEPKILSESVNPLTETQEVELDKQAEAAKEIDQDLGSGKRSRSTSLSSDSSVATVSTDASKTRAREPRPASRSRHRSTRSRSSSSSRLGSASRHRDKNVSHHDHQGTRRTASPRSFAHKRSDNGRHASDSDEVEASADRHVRRHVKQGDQGSNIRHERDGRNKRRRSQSPDALPDTRRYFNGSAKSARQRSLSPYSRRLALTQAMNSSS